MTSLQPDGTIHVTLKEEDSEDKITMHLRLDQTIRLASSLLQMVGEAVTATLVPHPIDGCPAFRCCACGRVQHARLAQGGPGVSVHGALTLGWRFSAGWRCPLCPAS